MDTETSRVGKLLADQAEEIVKLKKQNAELVEALQKIADIEHEHIPAPITPTEANLWGIIDGCVRLARQATGGE